MSIPFACPTCSHTHTADEAMAGKKARCRCGTILDIPFPNATPSSQERAIVQCSACAKKLSYAMAHGGKIARCSCGQTIQLPTVFAKAKASHDVGFSSQQPNASFESPHQPKPLAAASLPVPSINDSNTTTWAGASNWIRSEPQTPIRQTSKEATSTTDTIPGSLVIIGVLDCVYALLCFGYGGFCLIAGGFFTSLNSLAWFGASLIAYSLYNFGCVIAYGCCTFFAFNRYQIGWYVMSTVHAFGVVRAIATICLAVVSFQVSVFHVLSLFATAYGCWVLYALFQDEVRERFQIEKPIRTIAYSIGIPAVAFGVSISLGLFATDFMAARQTPTGLPWQGRGADEPDWANMKDEDVDMESEDNIGDM